MAVQIIQNVTLSHGINQSAEAVRNVIIILLNVKKVDQAKLFVQIVIIKKKFKNRMLRCKRLDTKVDTADVLPLFI